MSTSTIVDIRQAEPAEIRAALRRAQYGYVLALHIQLAQLLPPLIQR